MGKMTWKLRLMLAASFETVSNKQKQKNELANFWYSGFLCSQHSPPLPTASLVCPWRTADCGWCGMSWSWIKQLLGPQKTKLFQCFFGLKTNSREGQFCDCWAAAKIEDYLNISQLSRTCLISPWNTHLGQLEYCQKKEKWHPEQKKIRAVHPKKNLIVDHHGSTHRSHVQLLLVVGCNSLFPIHLWRCSLEVSDFTKHGLSSDSLW